MGATLNDIAKKVGVSQSTVSRVINGTAPISDEMKNKVYKAMKELNYHPNSLARNLAKGKSLTIGLVEMQIMKMHLPIPFSREVFMQWKK